MRNTITLNGKESSEIKGLLIQSLPPISKPLVRTQIEEIDGRDGDIVTKLGFSAYTKQFTIGLYGDFDINEVIAYFNSQGTVTFSNEPNKYYYYEIIDQIDFERLIRFRTATVSMHCQPYKYSATEGAYILEPPAENLLNIPNFTKTTNGITVTVQNGTITVKGTGTAATEFYVPTGGLTLPGGSYTLMALASGRGATSASIRLIKSAPSNPDTFGGNYITLKNAAVTISDTLSASTTYNYLWFYINAGVELNFTLETTLEDDAEKTATGEGTEIVLPNTTEAPFSQLDLKGDTFQQTYTGKNQLPYPFSSGGSSPRGITFTANSDGSVTLNGQNDGTGQTVYFLFNNSASPMPLSAGTYYFAPPTNTAISYLIYDGTYHGFSNSNNYTQTFNADTSVRQIYITVPQGNTTNFNNFKIYPMLTTLSGQTEADYEPYVGGIASPNPDYPQEVKTVTGEQTVKVSGKNLFDKNNYSLFSGYLDQSDTVVGSPGYQRNRLIYMPCQPNTTYSITLPPTTEFGLTTRVIANMTVAPVKGAEVRNAVRNINMSVLNGYTTDSTANYLVFYLQAPNGTNMDDIISDIVSYIQVEQGSTATDYEPYQSQEYELNLFENLYDKDSAFKSGSDIRLDINVQPNTTYIFKTGKAWTGAFLYDSNNTQTRKVGNDASLTHSVEFTTAANEVRARLTFYGGSSFDIETYDFSHIFFYVKNSIELCKIGEYQDYFYKDGGNWYLHKACGKVTVDGTEAWTNPDVNNTTTMLFQGSAIADALSIVATSNSYYLTNYFRTYNCFGSGNTNEGSCYHNDRKPMFRVKRSRLNTEDVNGWKTWLTTHNTTLYYALATPTDTQITNEALIEQLEALNSQAHSYKGTTHVKSTSDGTHLPHIIAASVAGNMDGTITNSGNTTARPKLTLFGSGNIGIYLNGVQIFQVALGTEGHITIDTNVMEAYKDTTDNLKNRLVTGDYSNFVLQAGENQIAFSGNATMCVVENYSRWI